jgi:hypothetical protein
MKVYEIERLYRVIEAMIRLARRDVCKRNQHAAEARLFLAWCEAELSIYLRLGDE